MKFRRRQFEAEMDAELRFHLESFVADLMRSGIPRPEAERRARLEFGSIEASKDECRQSWGLQRLDEFRADLRLAFRTIRRSPGFAAVAVLSLALGIGANTAIFSLYDAVVLRLLPVRDPARLVFINTHGTSGSDGPPYPFYELARDRSTSFEAVAAFSPSSIELALDRGRELARGVWVSGNFYEMLGVPPVAGRSLTAADDSLPGQGGPDGPVAVISRAFWEQRFGADPAVIGRTISLFDRACTIVGVMPTAAMSLDPGRPVDIAVPMALSDPVKLRDRTALWLFAVARLKPGAGVNQARAELEPLFHAYTAALPLSPEIRRRLYARLDLAPAAQGLAGLRREYGRPLVALLILAGLVLLASCINMTNLMLARAAARHRDFAVRLAIGASRGRLVRQHVTEALVLVAAGAAAGVLLAAAAESSLAALFAEGTFAIRLDLSPNLRVLLFTLALSALTALAVGIAPALRAARQDPAAGLSAGSRSIAGSRASLRLGRGLVIAQVALSMVLLAGAGLFIRSLHQLQTVDLGFVREGILTMEVAPERRLNGTAEWLSLQTELLERIRRIPGIRSAGWATMNPISGRDRGAVIDVPGFTPQLEADRDVHLAAHSPEYFDALGVPLLLGRHFRAADHAAAPKVAILNETAARFYFAGANPIGRKIRFTNYPRTDLLYEVIGVVRDTIHHDLRAPASRFVYVPLEQSVDRINRLALAARCGGDPLAFAAPVRRQVQGARSTLLITNISTMERQIDQSLLRERLVAALSTAFGAAALALAAIGLYGILAYAVTRRTNEIGIRMALGATRGEIVRMILSEAVAIAATGILSGLPVVVIVARAAGASLFGVQPVDARALAAAAGLLLAFAILAAAVPVRRASLLDPSAALRRD